MSTRRASKVAANVEVNLGPVRRASKLSLSAEVQFSRMLRTSNTFVSVEAALPNAPYLDGFDRADGALGPDWTGASSTPQIVGGEVVMSAVENVNRVWNPATFAADQRAALTLTGITATGTDSISVILKKQTSTVDNDSLIKLTYTPGSGQVSAQYYQDSGAVQTLGTVSVSYSAGDEFGGSVVGNTLYLEKNGDAVTSWDVSSYGYISQPGYVGFGYNVATSGNNFKGDKFKAGKVIKAQPADAMSAGTLDSMPYALAKIPTVVAVSDRFHTSGGASVTVTLPAHQANDIIIIAAETQGTQPTLPAGWTLLGSVVQPTDPGDYSSYTCLSVFWTRAVNSSTANPSLNSDDHIIAGAIVVRGAYTSGNPFISTVTGTKYPTSNTSTVPSITTTIQNSLVLFFASRSSDAGFGRYSGESNSNGYPVTEVFDNGTALINGGGVAIWSIDKLTSGSTGTVTATIEAVAAAEAYLTTFMRPAGGVDAVPADATSSGYLDPVDASVYSSVSVTCEPDDAFSATSLGSVSALVTMPVIPDDATSAGIFDEVTGIRRVQISPDDVLSVDPLDPGAAAATYRTSPDDAISSTAVEDVSGIVHRLAFPEGLLSETSPEEVGVTVTVVAVPNGAFSESAVDEVSTLVHRQVSVDNVTSETFIDYVQAVVHVGVSPDHLLSETLLEESEAVRRIQAELQNATSATSLGEGVVYVTYRTEPADMVSGSMLGEVDAILRYVVLVDDARSTAATWYLFPLPMLQVEVTSLRERIEIVNMTESISVARNSNNIEVSAVNKNSISVAKNGTFIEVEQQ